MDDFTASFWVFLRTGEESHVRRCPCAFWTSRHILDLLIWKEGLLREVGLAASQGREGIKVGCEHT